VNPGELPFRGVVVPGSIVKLMIRLQPN